MYSVQAVLKVVSLGLAAILDAVHTVPCGTTKARIAFGASGGPAYVTLMLGCWRFVRACNNICIWTSRYPKCTHPFYVQGSKYLAVGRC